MLSDSQKHGALGELDTTVLPRGWTRDVVIRFIFEELPIWRSRQDRPRESAETRLTSQLCAHLTSAARRTPGFDAFQFRVEEGDETFKARKIDLVAAAIGSVVVEGRRFTDFETILPVECKRLPIPTSSTRDPREYVITAQKTTGGIQRFKFGLHAASHNEAAMIAYVQEGSISEWFDRVQSWIHELCVSDVPGWTKQDLLQKEVFHEKTKTAIQRSMHERPGHEPIHLRHLWIEL